METGPKVSPISLPLFAAASGAVKAASFPGPRAFSGAERLGLRVSYQRPGSQFAGLAGS